MTAPPTGPMGTGEQPGGFAGGLKTAAPYIIGALSTAGEIYSSQQNRAEAERNREFQERMSSTSAQRAVADYKAAGLNPGLAYERGASSPGGAQANIGNPLSSGISSATSAKIAMQQLDMAQQVQDAQIPAIHAANARDTQAALLSDASAAEINQRAQFAKAMQPFMLQSAALDNALKVHSMPAAENKETLSRLEAMVLGPTLSGAQAFKNLMTPKTAANDKLRSQLFEK
ncbi:DNA pilot protein [Blackfly microvirus SF02]|uniref:DNA pilot protein n=1 Tax=Blackfly microvirus SF02 TaxID=2576452 RepID=A0A4P8PKQ1_9VIRU|nr:DNA pilot protein [Blackfly microvirus SF02]